MLRAVVEYNNMYILLLISKLVNNIPVPVGVLKFTGTTTQFIISLNGLPGIPGTILFMIKTSSTCSCTMMANKNEHITKYYLYLSIKDVGTPLLSLSNGTASCGYGH